MMKLNPTRRLMGLFAILGSFLLCTISSLWFPGTIFAQDRVAETQIPGNTRAGERNGLSRLPHPVIQGPARRVQNPQQAYQQQNTRDAQQDARSAYTFGRVPVGVSSSVSEHGREVMELLNGLNGADPANQDEIEKRLTDTLSTEFDAMQSEQVKQIEDMQRRLVELKSRHEIRNDNKDKIVQRRVIELMGRNDPFAWNQGTTPRFATPVPTEVDSRYPSAPLGPRSFQNLPSATMHPKVVRPDASDFQQVPTDDSAASAGRAGSLNEFRSAQPEPEQSDRGPSEVPQTRRELDNEPASEFGLNRSKSETSRSTTEWILQ